MGRSVRREVSLVGFVGFGVGVYFGIDLDVDCVEVECWCCVDVVVEILCGCLFECCVCFEYCECVGV